jgi:ElaB/YqjD/DUF883 family membrane-anchored ribosome-binding protein
MRNPEQIDSYANGSTDPSAGTLLRDVDEFLNYIAIVKTPEVDAVRASIERSLGRAKNELLKAVASGHQKASRGVSARSLRGKPWAAIAAAALLGAWSGRVLRRLTKARRHSVR